MENVKRGRGRPRKVAPEEQVGFFNPRSEMQEPISAADDDEKTMAAVRGSSLESGPTAPLPEKTLLVMVLDRLQKKDNYGLFSDPVDPNVVPDYHQIIKNPMDFGTLRKKLDDGDYTKLEEFEADVMLICSNAMLYNAPDTVYYRLARTIKDLAKHDFNKLRNEGKVVRRGRPPSNKKPRTDPASTGEDKESGEPQPNHVVRRGRPPSNKNIIENPSTEISPAANGYNLRKAPPVFYNLLSNDGTRFDEDYSEWNSDFPAHILREDMKYGKKHVAEMDVGRRDTYTKFHPYSSVSSQQPGYKRLVPVGFQVDPQAYARSLARFAGDLGPAVWEVACKKLKAAGLPFGRE